MADDQQDFSEFYRGLSYLGRPTSIALAGQEPSSPGGLQAGGAPVSPSGMGPAGPTTSTIGTAAGSGTTPGLSPALTGLLRAAGLGQRLGGVLSDVIGGGIPAGAMETPSGQLTFGAPESLRNLQFPDTNAPLTGAEASMATEAEQGLAGSTGIPGTDIYGLGTAGLGYLSSALGLINAIRPGTIPGGVGQALQAIGPLTGPGGIIGAGVGILAQIIMDEIADPAGRKSAVRDYNQIMSQEMPGEAQALQLAAATLPAISDKLTTEQAMQLYQLARAGVKSEQLLADPLSRQGREKAGVEYTNYPGLQEAVNQFGPSAWLATVRLQDLLAKRGVTPDQLATAESPFAQEFYGVLPQGGYPWMSPEQVATYQTTMPGGSTEGPSLWLQPEALLGMSGPYGGFQGQNLIGTVLEPGTTRPELGTQGWLFDPATMATLGGLEPGGYEAGLRGYLSGLPGFAGSPLAALWAGGGAPTEAAPAAGPSTAATTPGETGATDLQYPAPTMGGGTVFDFGAP